MTNGGPQIEYVPYFLCLKLLNRPTLLWETIFSSIEVFTAFPVLELLTCGLEGGGGGGGMGCWCGGFGGGGTGWVWGGLGVAHCGFLWVLWGAHCNTTFFLRGCCALPILSPASLFLFPCPSIPVPLLACLLHLYKIVGNVQMGSSNKFCTISVQQRWRQDSGERGGEDMPWVVLYWLEN